MSRLKIYLHVSTAALSVLLCVATVVNAGELTSTQRAALAKRFGVDAAAIRPSPVAGWFEISDGSDVAYVTRDGRYLFKGDLIDTQRRENFTDQRQKQLRLNMLAGVPDSQMIEYGPSHPGYTLTVFTDLDCGYCRRLHHAMPALNEAGIAVKYLFYPRAGQHSDAWRKAESVWCADDRKAALDKGFSGQPLGKPGCDANAKVEHDYQLALRLGAQGTPTIVLQDGRVLHGLPPINQLIQLVRRTQTE